MKYVGRLVLAAVLLCVTALPSHALLGGALTYTSAAYSSFNVSMVGVEVEAPFLGLPIPFVSSRLGYQTGKSGTTTVSPVTLILSAKIPATNIYGTLNGGMILLSDTTNATTIPGPITYGVGVGYEYGLTPLVNAFGQVGYQSASVTAGGTTYSLSGLTYEVGVRAGL